MDHPNPNTRAPDVRSLRATSREFALQCGSGSDTSRDRRRVPGADLPGYSRRVTRPVATSATAQIKSKLNHVLRKKRETELSIDHPGDQPCDCKISKSMDAGGEHSGQRTALQKPCDGGPPYCPVLRPCCCPAAPAPPSNPRRGPRPSETTRRSGPGIPPACEPTAGDDVAPGNRFQGRPGSRRRSSESLPAAASCRETRPASTTLPMASAWPSAMGTSDLATALPFCSCIPSATAKSQPIPGLSPW